ncbi:MAG: chemotaxis protein CheX [Magnetococcus sp. DMHC-6]
MKKELTQMIIESVHEVFLAFLFLEVKPGPAVVKPDDQLYKAPESETTSIVNFSGGLAGGVHLAAPLHVALELASALADEKFETMDRTAADGYGELANIVAGGIQTKLSGKFGNINLTPPTVISGTDYKMQYKSNFDSIKQYFKSEVGIFYVEFFFFIEGYKSFK